MDEEDHEAVCKLFITIGQTIDNPSMKETIDFYFHKMRRMSKDKRLNSRCPFMYKDLIKLRENNCKVRREQETTKTLEEIRRDIERKERLTAQQSQSYGGGYHGDRGGGGGRGPGDRRGGDRRSGGNAMGGRGDRRGGRGGD